MANLDSEVVLRGLRRVLAELVNGAPPGPTWVLDHDPRAGLVPLLATLDARAASRRSVPGRPSIAAHAAHLRFSLSLLNRWAGGEENPFAGADWKGSWSRPEVTEEEWRALREALGEEARAWLDALAAPREWDELSLTGSLASAAHVAYHLSAIRQMALAAPVG